MQSIRRLGGDDRSGKGSTAGQGRGIVRISWVGRVTIMEKTVKTWPRRYTEASTGCCGRSAPGKFKEQQGASVTRTE